MPSCNRSPSPGHRNFSHPGNRYSIPRGWIVLYVTFAHDAMVQTGQFEMIKQSIGGHAPDRRMRALLGALSFGASIEGAAGVGGPVAILAGMLGSSGFRLLQVATLSL